MPKATATNVTTHVDKKEWTLLMIVEDATGHGKTVMAKAETAFKNEQTHRKTLLFDPANLVSTDYPPNQGDRKAGRYVVLARNSRKAVKRGPISDLLLKDSDDAAIRSIRRAFAKGDKK